jgi:BirA family biotin operon repressor/biotin-[acetyl-CoA-carboxylase] ligase
VDAAYGHPGGTRNVIARVTCPSTQDIVRDEALAGAPAGTIAVTEHQSAGRGRRGRTWEAPPGKALMLSYLARPGRPPAELGPLALVVGIVVAERLPVPTRLRWPNDLVIGGGKTGGILVELVTPPAGPPFAVIGIGINANLERDELPPTDRLPATSLLVEGGAEVDRIALLESIAAGLDEGLSLFDRDGFAPFLPRWAALDALAGERLVLRLGDREAAGTAAGVDDAGRLLLRRDDGALEAHAAGEVERVLD